MGIRIGIFHNTSGIITRGLGELNKLLTRGLGQSKHIIKGAGKGKPVEKKITKEYFIGVFSAVKKKNIIVRSIIAAVKKLMSKNIFVKSGVNKKVEKSIGLKTKTSKKKLMRILDAI